MIRRSFIGFGTAVAMVGAAACADGNSGTKPGGQHPRDAEVRDDGGRADSGMDELDANMQGDGDGDGDGDTTADAGMDAASDAEVTADAATDSGADAQAEDAGSDASTDPPVLPALAAHYTFDENTGTVAADSAGEFASAELRNGAGWTDGVHGSALTLAGGAGNAENDYASLPADILDGCDDVTVALWMKLGAITFWSRLLDIDGLVDGFIFFTPTREVGGAPHLFFNIVHPNITGNDNQGVSAAYPAETTLVGEWHHVAFTLSGGTGRLYFDGAEIGSNAMATKPSDISFKEGAHAWLGRSLFDADAYLNTAIDDLRISCTAYTAAQVAQLADTE